MVYADDVMCFFRDGIRDRFTNGQQIQQDRSKFACLLALKTSSRDQMTGDPVHKSAHVGVDAGLVLLAATVSPAHHSYNVVGPIALAHQRASRVALRRDTAGGHHQGAADGPQKEILTN